MFVYRISLLCVATVHVDEKTLAEKKTFCFSLFSLSLLTIFISNVIKEIRHSNLFEMIETLSSEHVCIERTSLLYVATVHVDEKTLEKKNFLFLSILIVFFDDFHFESNQRETTFSFL